jgi:hypothetical protein
MVKCNRCGGQVIVRDEHGMRMANGTAKRAEYRTCVQCGSVEYFEELRREGATGRGPMMPTYHMRDSDQAFEDALEAGVLSHNESDLNWVGHYMYMCTFSGVDQFKHIDTRQHLNHNRFPDIRNAHAPRPKVRS